MNGKSLFLYILQNHIHHCVQIAFIILKQHMILLEFTFLKWILQPKLNLLHWCIADNETVQHQVSVAQQRSHFRL